MKNPRLEARRKKIEKDIDIFVEKSFDIADKIHELLKKSGKGQKDLAIMLGKSESEISKWLTGTHNFTLRTLSSIESKLQQDVIVIAGKERYKEITKVIYINIKPSSIKISENRTTIDKSNELLIAQSNYVPQTNLLA